jgi:hypothetical protein
MRRFPIKHPLLGKAIHQLHQFLGDTDAEQVSGANILTVSYERLRSGVTRPCSCELVQHLREQIRFHDRPPDLRLDLTTILFLSDTQEAGNKI